MVTKNKKESGIILLLVKLAVILALGFLTQFFIQEAYDVGSFVAILAAVVFMISAFYCWSKGFFNFILFSLIAISFFISLEISFELGFYLNFAISFVSAGLFSYIYRNVIKKENYDWLLLFGFAIVWVILGFNVLDRRDWILENVLNVPAVILVVFIARKLRFSKTSYVLMYLYMFMNVIGSHYTYAEVPFGYWLSNFFDMSRNHYDRIIHFCFGFLLGYPFREFFMRVGRYKGAWALFAPIMFVLGTSCVYELLEWWIAVIFGGDLGIAYLGSQGDVWDAQKDMFMAGIGSVIAMFITGVVILSYKGKAYLKDLGDSFRISKGQLGEVALAKIQRK
jgi:putative membrane protein